MVMRMLYPVGTKKEGVGMLMMTLNFQLTLRWDPPQQEGMRDTLYLQLKELVKHR